MGNEDILCEVKQEQIAYIVMTHTVCINKTGEHREDRRLRYITLEKEKAVKYMQACIGYVKSVSDFSLTRNSCNEVRYHANKEGSDWIVSIYLETYFLDFALSEF